MSRPNRPVKQRIPVSTEADLEKAREIIRAELGEGFWLETDLPRNVGVTGDERVLGESWMICSDQAEPAKYLANNFELLAKVSTSLTNLGLATRVLFEITAPGSEPKPLIMPE